MEEDRNRLTIAVWPDGTWCWAGEVIQMFHKSDDYQIITLSVTSEDEIEEVVRQALEEPWI